MTDDVLAALKLLQQRSRIYFYSSPYLTEQVDRAIDTILRNPNTSGKPFHLIKNALSDARKVLRRRSQICPCAEIKTCEDDRSERNIEMVADPRFKDLEAVFQLEDWLERTSLNSQDRVVLTLLLNGSEAKEIAENLGISVQQVRVWISRARKRAKNRWEVDTNV
ncbi:MAG: sigma factor-like helix-turn-helix DNA-binding protein [Nostoc sp.]|uniref:sigma factor-like helix-turn-helix DNA-binding protein n=1 Tax=Nostoc sp. TaxID=1180 RepID=UPI002FFB6BF0